MLESVVRVKNLTYEKSYHYYRLDEDPGETRDQIEMYPERIEEIDRLSILTRRSFWKPKKTYLKHPDVDPETEIRLRALGIWN